MQANEYGFYVPSILIHDFKDDFGYAREPVFARMPDGSLFMTVLTGGPCEPHNENLVIALRSEDDGETWSEPFEVFRHGARGLWVTELFTEGNVPMMIVHTYDAPSRYREITAFVSYTYDSGRSWTDPVSLPSGLSHVSVRRCFTLSNGWWLFPVYWQDVLSHWDWVAAPIHNGFHEEWISRCGALISKDAGKSFELHGDLRAEYNLFENNAVELEEKHIAMLIRAHKAGVLYRADSYDYGLTWTNAQPTDIPNPSSKITLMRVRDSVILLHNPRPDQRSPLSLWVSDDNMNSWTRKIDLTEWDRLMFYPHAIADDEKQLLYIMAEDTRKYEVIAGGEGAELTAGVFKAGRHHLLKLPYETFLK